MLCCGKLLKALFLVLFLLFAAPAVRANEISVRNPQLVANEDGYSLAADFNINFNSRLEEAVNKGVILYFSVDFELTKSRWYWFDEQVIRRNKTFQLSYHALTRQYRLSTGALHQSFASLDEVLRVLSRLRNWQVLEKGEIKTDHSYFAGMRISLDLTQMPKTFQVSALANKDWNLSSDWQHWNFVPTEAISAASGASPPIPPSTLPPTQLAPSAAPTPATPATSEAK